MNRPPKEIFKYNNENHSEKIWRIYHWLEGRPQPPYKVILVPTNRCNLKCFCCPNSYAREVGRFKEEEELTDKAWKTIIKEALQAGAKEFYILGGGEPFMRKDLTLSLIKMIKKKDWRNICEVITNLTLPDRKALEVLVKVKLDRILISIDSYLPETHDYVRGSEGATEKAHANLKQLDELKRKHETDKPVIQMNTVLSNRNFDQIVDIVKFAMENGVEELALHPMREYEETAGRIDHLKLTADQERIMLEQIREAEGISKDSGMFLNTSMVEETMATMTDTTGGGGREESEEEGTPDDRAREEIMPEQMEEAEPPSQGSEPIPDTGSDEDETATMAETHRESEADDRARETFLGPLCYEPFYSMFIDPLGNVNYCCAAGDGKPENNITQGLEKIWYGPFFKDVRQMIIANKPTEKCHACGLLDMSSDLRKDLEIYLDFLKEKNG